MVSLLQCSYPSKWKILETFRFQNSSSSGSFIHICAQQLGESHDTLFWCCSQAFLLLLLYISSRPMWVTNIFDPKPTWYPADIHWCGCISCIQWHPFFLASTCAVLVKFFNIKSGHGATSKDVFRPNYSKHSRSTSIMIIVSTVSQLLIAAKCCY